MNKWITEKWNWYMKLPWYWKITAIMFGVVILILLVISIINGNKIKIFDGGGSDRIHNDMVEEIIKDKIKTDEKLAKEIEEAKDEINGIIKEEKIVDEKADKAKEAIKNAKSVDEIRKILKGLNQ